MRMTAILNVQPGSIYAKLNGQRFTIIEMGGNGLTLKIQHVETCFNLKEVVIDNLYSYLLELYFSRKKNDNYTRFTALLTYLDLNRKGVMIGKKSSSFYFLYHAEAEKVLNIWKNSSLVKKVGKYYFVNNEINHIVLKTFQDKLYRLVKIDQM